MQQLVVHSSKRYLTLTEGTPFFWMGDTAWEGFQRLTRTEIQQYLSNRASLRFNVVQITALSGLGALDANAHGDIPLWNDNPQTPATTPGNDPNNGTEYDFWDHVDYTVQLAEANGIYVALLPTWGEYLWLNSGQPAEVIFTSNQKAYDYGWWIGNRYKDSPNVIWVLGGDRAPVDSTKRALIDSMAAGINAAGATQLMTYHPWGNSSSSDWFHSSSWLDFNMLQSGHNSRNRDNYNDIYKDYTRSGGAKPTIDGEPRYEDIPINFVLSNGRFDAYDARQAAYWAVFAGALGHTYGHNNVWQMYKSGYSAQINASAFWDASLSAPGATQMQYLRNLMESRSFLTAFPDTTFVTKAQSGMNVIRCLRGTDFAFVYSAGGLAFTVNLGRTSGSTVDAWWYNPKTGAATYMANYANSGQRTFTPPSSGRGNDWVLVLDDPASNYPDPGDYDAQPEEPADTIPPSAPTVSLLSKSTNSVTFGWTESTDNVAVNVYDVFLDGVYSSYLMATEPRTMTITGLIADTRYDITVKAKDSAQNYSAASNTLTVTTDASDDVTPPTAPTVSLTSKSTNSVTIGWTESTDNVAVNVYDVFLDGVYYSYLMATEPRTMTITGLIADTRYDITVKAKDSAQNYSAASNTLTVTTDASDDVTPLPTNIEGLIEGGIVDNTTAIQAALDEAYEGGGGLVVMPSGIYAHTGLHMRTNVTFVGQTTITTILRNTHASNSSISIRGEGSTFINNWSIRNMTLTAVNVQAADQHGLDLLLCHSFSIRDVNVENHYYGVKENIVWYGYFENLKISANVTGWYMPVWENASTPNTKINCHLLNNRDYGLHITDSVTQCTYTGGGIEWNGLGGILIEGEATREVLFNGLNIEGNGGYAIQIGSTETLAPTGICFKNCTIRREGVQTGSVGVYLNKGVSIELQNCKFFYYDTAIQTTSAVSFIFTFCSFDSITTAYNFDGTTIAAADASGYYVITGDWNGVTAQKSTGFLKLKNSETDPDAGVRFENGISLEHTFTRLDNWQYYLLENTVVTPLVVPANNTIEWELTVTDLGTTDMVNVNMPFLEHGLVAHWYIPSANTLRIRIGNMTASPINLTSPQNFQVYRFRFNSVV